MQNVYRSTLLHYIEDPELAKVYVDGLGDKAPETLGRGLLVKNNYGHTPIFYIKDPKIIEIYK